MLLVLNRFHQKLLCPLWLTLEENNLEENESTSSWCLSFSLSRSRGNGKRNARVWLRIRTITIYIVMTSDNQLIFYGNLQDCVINHIDVWQIFDLQNESNHLLLTNVFSELVEKRNKYMGTFNQITSDFDW